MSKLFLAALVVCLSLPLAVSAADPSGKWTAQVPGRNGENRETTFTLKAAGEQLTGSMSAQGRDVNIADGKVSGDTLAFTVTLERGGNSIKQSYTGKVAGDEIQFKREGGRGAAREFTAKRAR